MSYQSLRFLFRQNRQLLKVFDQNVLHRPLMIGSKFLYNTQRSVSDARAYNVDKESFLSGLKNRVRFQFKKYKLRSGGFQLYETIADNIDYEAFTKEFELPDTFHSWFVITELHVWMLMVRLMADPLEGRFTRNCVVEALWQDVTSRSKQLGSEHSSVVRKQVITLNEEFQAAIVSYDEGVLSEDRVLANSLWRRFFSQECDNPILIEAMVKYVRQTMFLLDMINTDDLIFNRKIRWMTMGELFEDLPKK